MWDRQSGRAMPYLDLGRSPLKTLGLPTGRVKAFCVPFGVPSATEPGGDAVMRWGNHTPCQGTDESGRRRTKESDGTVASSLSAEVSTTGFAKIAASGEYGPMRGDIGRGRLLSPRSARRTTPGGAGACYNFLYCIKSA
jgi:hypothetical protein